MECVPQRISAPLLGRSKALQITQVCDPISGSASWHVSGCASWRELGASWLGLNQHILAALRPQRPHVGSAPKDFPKGPELLRLEPRWDGAAIAFDNDLIMSETLDCFEPRQSFSMHERIGDTLSDGPLASGADTDIPPPCTPENHPCSSPCQWSSEQEPQILILPHSQGTQKPRRIINHADFSGRRGSLSYTPPSSRPDFGGFLASTGSGSLGSPKRTIEHLSSGERVHKRSRSAEAVPCSPPNRDTHSSKHKAAAVDFSVQCELCGQSCPLRQLAPHIQRHFTQGEICCPKEGCDWRGHGDFLKTHLEEVCHHVIIPCSFAASGCPAHVPRGKLGSHIAEFIENHLLLVAHENKMLRTRLHDMGAAQTRLQTRVDNLETVVLQMRTEEEPDESADDAASECSSAETDGVSYPEPCQLV